MFPSIVAIAIALIIIGVLVLLVYKALDTLTDFIELLKQMTSLFGKALPNLTPAQIFNLFVDIIAVIAAIFYAQILQDNPGFVLASFIIVLILITICLMITYKGRRRKSPV